MPTREDTIAGLEREKSYAEAKGDKATAKLIDAQLAAFGAREAEQSPRTARKTTSRSRKTTEK